MTRDRSAVPPEGDFTRAVLEPAVAAIPALLRVLGCVVLLPSVERAALRAVARRNLSEPQAQALAELITHREVAALLDAGRPFVPSAGDGLSPALQAQLRADSWPDLIAVPLPGTGRPAGALVLVPEGDGRWTPAKVQAAVDAGALLGAALRAAVRATDGDRHRRRTAALLERLPLLPDGAVAPDEALGRVVAGLGDALALSHCLGVLLKPEPAFQEYCQPGITPIGPPREPGQHPIGRLLRAGGMWSYDDAEASPADRSATGTLLNGVHPRSLLAVPVGESPTFAGFLLLVQADRRRRFADEERHFARAAAAELAARLHPAGSAAGSVAHVAGGEEPPAVAAALADARTPDAVAHTLLQAIGGDRPSLDVILLVRHDEATRRLILLGGVAGGVTVARDALPAPLGDDLVTQAVREERAAGGAGSRALPRPWRNVLRPAHGAQALALPAGGGAGHCFVVLAIGDQAALTRADALLRPLAAAAGVALSRAEVMEQAARREQQLTALNDMLLATAAAADVSTACAEAIAAIGRTLPGIDLVNVWLLDEEGTELRRVSTAGDAVSEERIARRFSLDSDSGVARAVRRRSGDLWQRDDANLPAGVRDLMEQAELETIATIPMRTLRGVSGTLSLGSVTRRLYHREELTFLETLAGQLGGQLDLVQVRERAESERQRLVSLVDALPEGLFVIEPDATVRLSNPAADRVLGFHTTGRPLAEVFEGSRLANPDGRVIAWTDLPFVRALAGETVAGVELLLSRGDGSETPLLFNCRPVGGPDRRAGGAVCVFQDLTPLSELSTLKNDFVNTVSHELRTPITTIRGGALTLLKRRQFLEPETQNELLNDIAEEAERLHLLVEDLLSLTRSRTGINVSPEPMLIGRLINRVITELGGRVGGHTLQVHIPADLPPVDADPALTQKVVRNLLENAVKFSPRGQQIEVEAEQQDSSVVVSVLDRGSGVPLEDLDRVFEPFYRPDATVRSGAQGAGLGLAVCRRLAEMQGGRIWAEAREGGGAAFRFTLPVAEE